jgi:hypothetical protein
MSPVEALDYWAVHMDGRSETEWAQKRGVTQQAVSSSVNSALDIAEQDPDVWCSVVEELVEATAGFLEGYQDTQLIGRVTTEVAESRLEEDDPFYNDTTFIINVTGIDIDVLYDLYSPETSKYDSIRDMLQSYWHQIVGSDLPMITIGPNQTDTSFRVTGFTRV